ncbi:MAG: GNAT family N-acetyltransferase [Simkaniaceae bacterium]|nr:MAG: GNAT family N-acetyltransferase [Simkaniaceae bacterium]
MECLALEIKEEPPSWDLEKKSYEGFLQHSVETLGYDGDVSGFAFVYRNEGKLLGHISGKSFYGGLHIKHLIVDHTMRGKGVGTALMNKALKRGKELGCKFAYLETLNFQAPEFYQKLGFTLEFIRRGYNQDVSMYYLRKEL